MAGKQLGRRAKPREPEKDFAPPPPYPVVWVVMDREDTFNKREAFAQTAYRAYELSGIARDGVPLSFSECHVYYSEHLTRRGVEALVSALEKLCARPKKSKQNGIGRKANGHAG